MTAAALKASAESQPYWTGFSPDVIPYQRRVLDLVRDFNYESGNLEILLSGSFGSAKSVLMAHLLIRHCVRNKRAHAIICRRGLPDLKKTIWQEILEHMEHDFIEVRRFSRRADRAEYKINRAEMTITFRNGSKITCGTWADKRYKKFRSLKLSMIVIEEIVENDDDDAEAFKQLKARLRRRPQIRENLLIAATNPDAPSHWVYKQFVLGARQFPNRFVFYSRTEDNPFLDPIYVQELRRDMSPKEAKRYLDGEWIELAGEVIYYEYEAERQFFRDRTYEPDKNYPIICTWDFNIGDGKPMSMACGQYINDEFHWFAQVIISGARTADTIDELDARGILKKEFKFIICGDASGKNRDTRSSKSDYDIIIKEFQNREFQFDYFVPLANPPIRTRHNRVNAYCKNAIGQTRMWIYQGCDKIDEGFRLTKLKSGANYIEDDSKDYQHVTTAIGYATIAMVLRSEYRQGRTIQL